MQFAAQRTDADLQPIGDPYNYLIRLAPDVLPDPEAVLITGITPQKTHEEGISEADFLRIFHKEIAAPDTIITGFNSVRFDDEFIRHMNYRNFYDPYEWSWKDGRSRWDMLDVVRMTRALRPDGISWPFASDGSPTNRLELLTDLNNLSHEQAHDALSDVHATIAVAKLIKQRQPKLFEFLLKMRDKRAARELVTSDQPFIYTSGRYESAYEKTTVAMRLADVPGQSQASLVFDLRYDPSDYLDKRPDQLAEVWRQRHDERDFHMPVKSIKYNKCPAIAPMGVLDTSSQKRLAIDTETVRQRQAALQKHRTQLQDLFLKAHEITTKKDQQTFLSDEKTVDERLYDAFIPDEDKRVMQTLRQAKPEELTAETFRFSDERLRQLLPLYKARNYPDALTPEETEEWETYRHAKLTGGSPNRLTLFARSLQRCAERPEVVSDDNKRYLLEELQLYAESIAPIAH